MKGRLTPCPAVSKKGATRSHGVSRIAFAHNHLIGTLVGPGRSHGDFAAHGPEAQQPDSELTLKPSRAAGFQPSLDGIADMGGDVMEIRTAILIARHAFTVISDRQEMTAVLPAPRDRDRARLRVNAVLDKFRNGLERIALRQSDDRNRIPVVSYLELAARPGFHSRRCHRIPLLHPKR